MLGDRLLAYAGLCLRDEDDPALQVDVFTAHREDLALAHGRSQPDDDERVDLRIAVRLRALDKPVLLIDRQVRDPAAAESQALAAGAERRARRRSWWYGQAQVRADHLESKAPEAALA